MIALGVSIAILPACIYTDPPNPYDDVDTGPTDDNDDPLPSLDPNSIQGIHQNVFLPTCANSGCHDGTFEPDFRTVESTYATLVNHPVIKNDGGSTYAARVVPYDADGSMLWRRLNEDLPASSGIMPLEVDVGSDWYSKKTEYLNNIKTWINNGARDQFGNTP